MINGYFVTKDNLIESLTEIQKLEENAKKDGRLLSSSEAFHVFQQLFDKSQIISLADKEDAANVIKSLVKG
jgi:hypothetical protein